MLDVVAMSIKVDVEGRLCLPNVLLSALPAFNQVDHVPCLAGGCSTYVEGLFCGTRRCLRDLQPYPDRHQLSKYDH